MMADINGDGRADIVGFGKNGVHTSLSTGTGFMPASRYGRYGFCSGWKVNEHPRMMADVNGDGRSDIVAFDEVGAWASL